MKTALRMTVPFLVIGSVVVACSGGSTPVDPKASSARDVDGGLALHETAHGAIGVGNGSGGATPVDPKVSSARDVHGGFLPPGSTNGAGGGRVHPFDTGSCQNNCCFHAKCPYMFDGFQANTPQGTWEAAFFACSDASCANAIGPDSATNVGNGAIANPTIELVFWGFGWTESSPSMTQVTQALKTVMATDYFAGLAYYGVSSVKLDPTAYIQYGGPSSSPYSESDAQSMVDAGVSSGQLPADPNGNDTIYLVMMPPGTTPPQNCGANGANGQWDHNVAYVAFSDLDSMMASATHELVEAITDPGGNGWRMDRDLDGYELGDACHDLQDFLGGVMVQSYWSNEYGSCIIPFPPCGEHGQTCCGPGSSCSPSSPYGGNPNYTNFIPCNSISDVCSNGACVSCGGTGEPCCAGNTPCTGTGAECVSGSCCTPLTACQPNQCGTISDGCGGTITCAGGQPCMTITGLNFTHGGITGGTLITISGSGFDPCPGTLDTTNTNMRVSFVDAAGHATPASEVICSGATQVGAVSPAVSGPGPVDIRVSYGVLTTPISPADVFTYTALPGMEPQGILTSWNGNSLTGSLGIDSYAPTGGASITITSSNPSLVAPPSPVVIPAGAKYASFSITTPTPSAARATLTATYAGTSATTQVTPAPPTSCPSGEIVCAATNTCLTPTMCNKVSGGGGTCKPGTCS
jgi:hypothetical protein